MAQGPGPLLDTLAPLLRRAGEAAMAHFRSISAQVKPDGTQVTLADREAEEILVQGLARAFPQAAVRGEEGTHQGEADDTWYVDPIDGTSSFVEGLAHWGPTVCLVREGRLEAGAFYSPRLDELWFAQRGAGAWLDGRRLDSALDAPLHRNHTICVPSRFHKPWYCISWPGKVRALGSSAAHLALVAAGATQATLVPAWHLWDVGCGILLVEEVGLEITDLHGDDFDPVAREGEPFWAGTPRALQALTTTPALRWRKA